MKTIKLLLFAIFVLLLSDEIASLAFAYGLGHTTYIATRLLGVLGSTGITIWALVQD